MDEVWELIIDQAGWLERRVRHALSRFDGGALTADVEDCCQEVLVRFVERASQGWFDKEPTESIEARVRHLLMQCLRHVTTDKLRALSLAEKLTASAAPRSAGWPGASTSPEDPDDAINEAQRKRAVLASLQHDTNPARRLIVLALYFPMDVKLADIEAAKAYRVGGSRAVCRSVDDTFELLKAQRARSELVLDSARWKRIVAEILRLESPFGSGSTREIEKAVNNLDVQSSRAILALEATTSAALDGTEGRRPPTPTGDEAGLPPGSRSREKRRST